jgi:hypothetical protein
MGSVEREASKGHAYLQNKNQNGEEEGEGEGEEEEEGEEADSYLASD